MLHSFPFSDLLHGPWPQSPFPGPRREPAAAPQQPTPPAPDWHRVISASPRYPYFNAVSYFSQCYGVLPWCRIFKLGGEMPRADLLAELATRFDLIQAALAHAEYFRTADYPAEYPHTALLLAPHLLLEIDDEELFRVGQLTDVTLYYSPATNPTLLQELTQLLHSRLKSIEHVELAELFYVLQADRRGSVEFSPAVLQPTPCDLPAHYNDDLLPAHETIVRRLATDHDKGLVILHGPPGTGKTSYLRHLCGLLPHKKKLFVPPHLAAQLADPGFMRLLTDVPNAILLIEDAEQLLLRRDKSGGGPSAVSGLLNLTDGLLADALHIQVVCTFNTDLALIDPAILRKGRLIAAYYFGPLALPKTQALAAATGWPTAPATPLTLAELFNPDEADFSPVTSAPVGFVSSR